MDHYTVEKSFLDYADDIEAVNIHYVLTLIEDIPDWEHHRCTRFMPLVQEKMRRKTLKLPKQVETSAGVAAARYLLHYYFEIFQDGDRHYTQLFTEEINTDSLATSATSNNSKPARLPQFRI
jgi:hypothetical protein